MKTISDEEIEQLLERKKTFEERGGLTAIQVAHAKALLNDFADALLREREHKKQIIRDFNACMAIKTR
jgi:hypothetical protein